MANSDAVAKVLDFIKENGVEYVDLRFTDPKGKWQHTAQHISTVDADSLTDGFMFDGSSIAGWKAINESDMILAPDLETFVLDPFAAKPSLILFCDILEPATGQGYVRDPRSTAKKAEAYLKSTGIGDTVGDAPVIAAKRHVGDHQRSSHCPPDGARMMQHLINRD